MKLLIIFFALFLAPLVLTAQAAHTHADGTTHAASDDEHEKAETLKAGTKSDKDHFTVYGASEKYELTLYYPELVAGEEAHLTLFAADYQTNRPIEKAVFKISATEDAKIPFEVMAVSPGVYQVHVAFPANKAYSLSVEVAHPNGADLLGLTGIVVGQKLDAFVASALPKSTGLPGWLWFLGGLVGGGLLVWFASRSRNRSFTVLFFLATAWLPTAQWNPLNAHGDEPHGPAQGGNSYGKTIDIPKETQFLFEVLTQPLLIGDNKSSTSVFGTVVPASGGLAAVVVPQNGRITKVNVRVGQTVKAGQTIAVLQQSLGTADQVGLATNANNLTLQIETAKTRVAATKRELDRIVKIADIAAGKDVQAAEAAYNQAKIELQTLESNATSNQSATNSRLVALVAPISGVVGAFTLTPGTEVVIGQTLMTITNLGKVFIEAQVFDRDLPDISGGKSFSVICNANGHKSTNVKLISLAQSMNPGNQSQRVLFELLNPDGDFKLGEFVTVYAIQSSSDRGLSVPNSSLTEINGKTAVFLKQAPETFELAFVQTGEDDGTRTLILKGIEESEKIAVSGVYELKMIFLNH
jgi:cobalt-zinc-cadmium efflux system membrane fusion protein